MFDKVRSFITKELILEWRQKYALNGILLYTISTIFICYLSFSFRGGSISPLVWNTLFWIIILFSAINAVAKSFLQENPDRNLYYYTIIDPLSMIIAKIIYNTILMILVALLAFAIYSILLGNPIQDHLLFIINLLLGSIGFATVLTMISGIASKAQSNSMLMAILSFPIIIPLMLMLIKVSKNAMDGLARSESIDEILVLLSLNAITIALALLLFPFLWRN